MLAEPEDRDDIGVVQSRRRPRLALEALKLLGVANQLPRQDLEGDMTAQRDLLGLVDNPHPAVPDLADDPEVAQLLEPGCRDRRAVLGDPRHQRLVANGDVLHHGHRRKHFADFPLELGMKVDVLLEPGTLPQAIPLQKLLGELQHDR